MYVYLKTHNERPTGEREAHDRWEGLMKDGKKWTLVE